MVVESGGGGVCSTLNRYHITGKVDIITHLLWSNLSWVIQKALEMALVTSLVIAEKPQLDMQALRCSYNVSWVACHDRCLQHDTSVSEELILPQEGTLYSHTEMQDGLHRISQRLPYVQFVRLGSRGLLDLGSSGILDYRTSNLSDFQVFRMHIRPMCENFHTKSLHLPAETSFVHASKSTSSSFLRESLCRPVIVDHLFIRSNA